jgi:uncharacterized protein
VIDRATQTQDEYRILSLSGGGVRGIVQARLLELLERDVGPIAQRFDLVAATSTGALVGLGLAAGVPASQLVRLYRDHASEIFRRRPLALIRRGPRYQTERLREVLQRHLGTKTLGELDVEVVVCASALNRYQGKIFTSASDPDVALVDAALASAAAPTYFAPVVPRGSERGYLDGGLWANDPILVASAQAISQLGIPANSIDALSIGTGRVVRGCTPDELEAMRTASLDTVSFLLEISGSLQEWGTRHALSSLVPAAQVRRINPELSEWVELDEVKRALDLLPGIAETEYEDHRRDLVQWLSSPRRSATPAEPPLDPMLEAGVREAGISRFIPARRFYSQYRGGHDSISAYISDARQTLTMVSINLATGAAMEQIERAFAALLERENRVRIRVSLLDYDREALMESIASVLNMRTQTITQRISDAMGSLLEFRHGLEPEPREQFELYLHRTIPSASAILIDANSPQGTIQLETKPYKAPLTQSWAVEVTAGSDFFETLRSGYHDLISDGDELGLDGQRLGRAAEQDLRRRSEEGS